jgi:hypothetical protein
MHSGAEGPEDTVFAAQRSAFQIELSAAFGAGAYGRAIHDKWGEQIMFRNVKQRAVVIQNLFSQGLHKNQIA